MENAIYIASSYTDSSEDDVYLFPEDYNLLEPDDEWPHVIGEQTPGVGSTARLPKKQKTRGPNGTAFSQTSLSPLTSLGPNSSRYPQEAGLIAPAADSTDTLLLETLEMFPDISHTYVKDLIARHRASVVLDPDLRANGVDLALSRDAVYEEILEQKSYPKQNSENAKRKREDLDENEDDWESNTMHQTNAYTYSEAAATVLGNEFPFIPMQHVRKVLREKKRLYSTFLALYSDENLVEKRQYPYPKLKNHRNAGTPKRIESLGGILTRELKAAKKQAEKLHSALRKKKDEAEAEKANEEEHIRTGNLIECQCCYSDVPANRCLPCEGIELHLFCFTCIRRSADTQIGLMKYTLQCFDVSGCQAPFSRSQLKEVLGSLTMEKLDSLQQEYEIQQAGLEGLEDCPFCSFKAVLPPVEEDREFRCENSSCKVVSCRLCKEKSHIPMTCEEFRKDNGLSERHRVEEAMSNALIRKCPKCQVQIIKESGCNKMQCTKCHTMMCYVCQKDITKQAYAHFGRGCPQSDFITQDEEVDEAERAAIDKILAENPELTEEQIRVGHEKLQNNQAQYIYPIRGPIPDMGRVRVQHHNPRPIREQHGIYPQPLAQNLVQPRHYAPPVGMMYQGLPPNFGITQRVARVGNPAPPPARGGVQMQAPQPPYINPPFDIYNQERPPMADYGGRYPHPVEQPPQLEYQRGPPENPNAFGHRSIFGPF
ncbi:hypothetical protein BJX76DRAFT_248307 [Aspergillus varians]